MWRWNSRNKRSAKAMNQGEVSMISSADILNARILIVDDQEANVLLLERMLRGAGYASVASTMDPSEVCELHRKNRYDLILLDLQMPGMDGFQVMEGLKEIEPDGYLPVLVITAQPGHKLRALQAGAKDFVSKPFDLAEVLARVHNMLEVRLLYAELQKALEQVKLPERPAAHLHVVQEDPRRPGLLERDRALPRPAFGGRVLARDLSRLQEEILRGDVRQGKMRNQLLAGFSSACCREESSVINVR